MFPTAVVWILALVVSWQLTQAIRQYALNRAIIDVPNERSSHSQPTPRGGGLALVVVTIGGAWVFYLLLLRDSAWFPLLMYTIGAVLIAGVSWLDDLRSLSNRLRLATHVLGALIAVVGLGFWHTIRLPFFGPVPFDLIGLLITIIWIVGLTNAYNFMDGIDGIAGSQAVVAGLGWAVLGWRTDDALVGLLGLLLTASSLGFLGHNWPPARIFMGDVGSAFLGYSFAVLPLIAMSTTINMAVWDRLPLTAALLVWPFVFDTVLTFLRRLRAGENVFAPHRSHLYQRLIITGHSHRFVTLLYIGLAVVGFVLAFVWWLALPGADLIVGMTIPLLCVGLWAFVGEEQRRHLLHNRPERTPS
ncbi:MAG: glycosyltransferase family 4 protein [Chloroflexaceae bacterium]|nr:glycosyltransferase family 4 protein [Chloroflexaceae bacterium]